MPALSQQPVSFAIEADQFPFPLFMTGVLAARSGTKLNHGVPPFRYGTENSTDYWQVKPNRGAARRVSRLTGGLSARRVVNVVSCLDHPCPSEIVYVARAGADTAHR